MEMAIKARENFKIDKVLCASDCFFMKDCYQDISEYYEK